MFLLPYYTWFCRACNSAIFIFSSLLLLVLEEKKNISTSFICLKNIFNVPFKIFFSMKFKEYA